MIAVARKYKFHIVLVEGEWWDLDDAMMEWGDSVYGRMDDSFEVEVEAENWKDAREKILTAAEALRNPWRP
ncbi:hypothetical protein [Thermococcus sp.]